MGGMSEKDWETLHENFETADLLRAVDCFDALRGYFNDREHFQPPEIRDELLKLHGLARARSAGPETCSSWRKIWRSKSAS
jgi:hypothetical protein